MIVTDKQYYMDNALLKKLDLMILRCVQKNPKRDAVLIVEGGEGEGKTTMACCCAYYIHHITKRPFSNANIFFEAEKILKFAQETENQIIIYDEPALDMLSAEWWKREQKNIIKLLMVARKKRHFFIFNLTKFYKFPEYVVVDRGLGMIHVYSRNDIEAGRFVYIRKKSLEFLYNDYRRSKVRKYKRYASFRGTFSDVLAKIIDEVAYNKEKDAAILKIGTEQAKVTKTQEKIQALKYNIASIVEKFKLPAKEIAEMFGVEENTLKTWLKYKVKKVHEHDTSDDV